MAHTGDDVASTDTNVDHSDLHLINESLVEDTVDALIRAATHGRHFDIDCSSVSYSSDVNPFVAKFDRRRRDLASRINTLSENLVLKLE